MGVVYSKLTAQGQISVPASIRRKLGLRPGSVLEWHEGDEGIVVKRAGRFSSEDVHRALFPEGVPGARTVEEMKAAIRRHVKKRHARD
jgi:AbrB family looped-hinge helix DNA binding protein